MSDRGIFMDILARLDMASVGRAIGTAQEEFRRGGRAAGDAFAEGGVSGLRVMQDEFRELSRASDLAYGDMQRGLANLQVEEARINQLRAEGFRRSSDEMVAAEQRIHAAIAETDRLLANSRRASFAQRDSEGALAASGVPYRRGEEEDRGRPSRPAFLPAGLGRAGNALGIGAVAATAFGGIDVTKQAAQMEDTLNRLVTVTGELPKNLNMIQNAIMQIATKTGYNPQDLANVSLQAEKRGYQGDNLAKILDATAQLSRMEKVPLEDALQGLAVTAENYKVSPDQLADLASKLNVAVGRSGTGMQGFSSALPNIEPVASLAEINQNQVWGVLAQLTKAGFSPDRASLNEADLVKQLSGPNGPARDMLNTLFTQAGSRNAQGKPMTAADISNNLPQLQLTGAVNEIFNKAILPNLTQDQRVLLPDVFKNEQAQENIESMMGQFTDPNTLAFANSPLMAGGAMSPMQVTKAAEKAGVNPEDIAKLRDLAKAQQVQHGFSAQLKGRDSDVESIQRITRTVFGDIPASRVAMAIGANPQAQAETEQSVAAIEQGHADPQGNVEGFAKAMDTAVAQTDRFKASMHDAAIVLGEQLTPTVKTLASGLADFAHWLSENKIALDGFAAVLGGIATIWAGSKLIKGAKNLFEPTANLAKWGADKVGAVMPNTGVIANPYGGGGGAELKDGAAAAGGELREGGAAAAGALREGAGAGGASLREGASSAAAQLKEGTLGVGAELRQGAAAAGEELKAGAAGAAMELREGAAGMRSSLLGGAGGALGTAFLGAGIGNDALEGLDRHFSKGSLPDRLTRGFLNNPMTGIGAYHWLFGGDGNANGGIVGYWSGGKVADPYSQPLLNQPDMKRDSLLGMLPSGMPVGLRGGEGILTPDAVARLGGKSAIDSLNSGLGKWANPVYTATTFYDSFATGFAKYSPYGKPLKASAESLKAMLKDQMGDPQGGRGRGGMPKEIEEMLAAGMSPEEILQSLGATQGKRGGFTLPNGSYLSREDRTLLGIPTSSRGGGGKDLVSALVRAGIDPKMYPMLEGFSRTEGNNPSGAPTLGFTDSQAGGTLDGHAQALARQIRDRQSVAGPFPVNGTPQQQASWMATVVGQDGVQSDWQGNAQPSRQDYVNRIVGGFGNGWWGIGRSAGGIVGFADGGITPGIPGPFGGTNNGTSPGVSTRQNTPDWWHGGRNNGDVPPWWNGAQWGDRGPDIGWGPGLPGHWGSGGSPGLPMFPSGHGPMMGYDEGGVVSPWTQAKGGGAGVLHPTDLGGLLGGAGGGYGKPGAPAKLSPQKPDIAPPDTGGLPPMHGGVSNLAAAQGDPNLRAATDDIKGKMGPPPSGPPGVNSAPGSAPAPGIGVKPAPTAEGRTALENPSRPEGMSNDSKGFGIGGGIIGAAESAASSMGGPIGGAAQPAMQLMNRAIGYGGQLAAIGLTGLMETFLPNNSELADPSNSLPGKIIFGLAGAHPSNPNVAGKSASQIKPEEAKSIDEGADKNKLTPTVNIQGDIHNYSGEGTAVQRAIEHGFTAATNGMNINN